MYLEIKIEMGNDAFVNTRRGETARILRKLADQIARDGVRPGYEWALMDANGNRVGTAEVKGDEE